MCSSSSKGIKNMESSEKIFSLSALAAAVKNVIDKNFTSGYLVAAEIQSVMQNRSGHAYLELIEKAPESEQVVSQMRATIWANKFRILKPYFESMTGCGLRAGIKILVRCSVSFHVLYGLSLNITDIMPEFTAGELAMQRKRTVERLKSDGVFDMNREKTLPRLVKRIAVISSATAAGYGDFLKQLQENPYGYKFSVRLFEAVMQGAGAESSVCEQLDRIFEQRENFDCVAVIRGGGGKTDLTCFDSYNLAFCLCQFPLPVLTGIGHDRDESVADLVAFRSLKTPTATAQFFIDKMLQAENELNRKIENIRLKIRDFFDYNNRRVSEIDYKVRTYLRNFPAVKKAQLEKVQNGILNALRYNIQRKKSEVEKIEAKTALNSPETILKKGFIYAQSPDGKFVMKAADLKPGDSFTAYFQDGKAVSEVKKIEK